MIPGDSCLLAFTADHSFQFWAQESGGRYVYQFSHPADVSRWLNNHSSLTWNGEQLAVLLNQREQDDFLSTELLYLAVFDRTGLLYAETLDRSLNRCLGDFPDPDLWQPVCRLWAPDPISLSWT